MPAMNSDRVDHVTVADEEAYSCLLGHGLPVLRVEISRPSGQVIVTWRNPPTAEHQAKANSLFQGTAPTHVI